MTRKEIYEAIEEKENSIQTLKNEIKLLRQEDTLLSDESQQYYEKVVDVTISRRPKVTEKQLHGFIKWKEYFTDEDRPNEPIEIERNMLVRIDGRFINF